VYLRRLGAETILGGEFEPGLAALAKHLSESRTPQIGPVTSLDRLTFLTPDRLGLPAATRYARLHLPDGGHRVTGYTEASRGCKHLCRHCPVVPVYQGAFRIVQKEVVIEDIARQVAAGSEHIVFGDPDFFNGPTHAMAIVSELHRRFPLVTYDVTIKIEHLLKHTDLLPELRDTGCLVVTSAVESVDDGILARLEKGHTRADFLRVVAMFRDLGMVLNPTFLPFTPWTTLEGYRDLLGLLVSENLVNHVAPVQLAIRLLIPAGSRLLELPEIADVIGPFDEAALVYPWRHPDPRMDELAARVQEAVAGGLKEKLARGAIFARIVQAAGLSDLPDVLSRAEIPYLNEPWYC
jgi:radical SAM superfamily enzyme YgiQ (UPF0313 family)